MHFSRVTPRDQTTAPPPGAAVFFILTSWNCDKTIEFQIETSLGLSVQQITLSSTNQWKKAQSLIRKYAQQSNPHRYW